MTLIFPLLCVIIENEGRAVIQLLNEAGCEVSETSCTSAEVREGEWMYAGFDLSRYTFKEAETC